MITTDTEVMTRKAEDLARVKNALSTLDQIRTSLNGVKDLVAATDDTSRRVAIIAMHLGAAFNNAVDATHQIAAIERELSK